MSEDQNSAPEESPLRTHEEHWGSAGVADTAALATLVAEVLENGDSLSEDEVVADWEDGSESKTIVSLHYPESDLCTLVHISVTDDEEAEPVVISSLPMLLGEYAFPVEIIETEDFGSPTVGLIRGVVEGKPVEFIDGLYTENKPILFAGEVITFGLAAMAYDVVIIEGSEVVEYTEPEVIRAILPASEIGELSDEELEPVQVELEGAILMLPAGDGDYELITEVFDVEETVAFGQDFWKLTVGLWAEESDDEDEQVSPLTVFVAKALYPKETPEEGDGLRMMVWLQGVVTDPDDEEDEDEEDESSDDVAEESKPAE